MPTPCSNPQERDTVTPIQMAPSSYAQLGFPTIKEVDLRQRDESDEGKSGLQTASPGGGKERKKKKSLFAKQFGEMPLSVFGMVDQREGVSTMHIGPCTMTQAQANHHGGAVLCTLS